MDPTEEDVAASMEEVWAQVVELASTAKGRALMQIAADNYWVHDE
jgi:hypothetical protein